MEINEILSTLLYGVYALILMFVGYKVFDPFLGTGTTGIAAHYGDCDFVGCELDTDYFNAAKARIERETAQLDMF